jgi:hypothetical protein
VFLHEWKKIFFGHFFFFVGGSVVGYRQAFYISLSRSVLGASGRHLPRGLEELRAVTGDKENHKSEIIKANICS